MPELPEVEVVRQGLHNVALGRRLERLVVRERRLRWPIEVGIESELEGQRLVGIHRRGKYLLLDFVVGTLISHLGMSGSWRVAEADQTARIHDHVDLAFEGCLLRYHDPRRFGSLHWHRANAGDVNAHSLLSRLGIEPLGEGFSGALLHQRSRGRAVSIKQFLLSGSAVVGVGNIYCSEALFRAGIRPTLAAGRISLRRYERLAKEIRDTLDESIRAGGSTLRDFVGSDGEHGQFQSQTRVYGRAGEPCMACGTLVRKVWQQQRATYYCPRCQR